MAELLSLCWRGTKLQGEALLILVGVLLTGPFVLMGGRAAVAEWAGRFMRWSDDWEARLDAYNRDVERGG